MKTELLLLRVSLVALSLAAVAAAPAADRTGGAATAARRVKQLARGVNLAHWFSQVYTPGGYDTQHLETFIRNRDLALLHRLGFTFVRLPISPSHLMNTGLKTKPLFHRKFLARVDRAIRMILAHHLAVVVDMHGPNFNKSLESNLKLRKKFVRFWGALAAHLAPYNAHATFLELLNEPAFKDDDAWIGLQACLAAKVRKAAPHDTIIATGPGWSAIANLLKLPLLRQRNVIYTFHYYAPMTFTHQGSTWSYPPWRYGRNLPYPSSPAAVAKFLPALQKHPKEKWAVQQYGKQQWNRQRIATEIGRVAAWAKKRHVSIFCGEFGVYRRFAPPAARRRWLHDMTSVLHQDGIGWSMWDYAGGDFSLVRRNKAGVPVIHANTAKGLGIASR